MREPVAALYSGREHSRIKHVFLTEYLKSAAFKTLLARSNTFNYVDGFAGPWSVSDTEGYRDSSFDQSITTLLEVKEALESAGRGAFEVRFFLCEKNAGRAADLRNYATRRGGLSIEVYEGAFEQHLKDIANRCAQGFTFTFIDPTGFKLNSIEIADYLRRVRGEFLLNFMSEHINRFPTLESVQGAFGLLLAQSNWREQFNALPASMGNEEKILLILKRRFKELGAAKYLPDFAIMNASSERLQMRLVLGTRSPKGVEVFRDVQKKADEEQIATRDFLKSPQQETLFAAAGVRGVGTVLGSVPELRKARAAVLDCLTGPQAIKVEDMIGPVLEASQIRLTHLKDLLVTMHSDGLVKFVLPDRARKPSEATLVTAVR